MNPKVSVIIPVYQVEKYIERCAISLFEQSLTDIEYIFVNDCTKDKSIEVLNSVLQRYPSRQNQCQIINHETNQGLPSARKTGLEYATGEYIAHCDSDDWVEKDAYESLYKYAQSNGWDMAICGFYMYMSDNEIRTVRNVGSSDVNCLTRQIVTNQVVPSIWTKFVRREVYERGRIAFPTKNIAEDLILSLELIINCRNVGYIDEPLYYYFYNSSAMTKQVDYTSLFKRMQDIKSNVETLTDYVAGKGMLDSFDDYITYIKLTQKNMLLPFLRDKNVYKLWRCSFPEIYGKILKSNTVHFKQKIKTLLIFFRLLPL